MNNNILKIKQLRNERKNYKFALIKEKKL